MDRAGVRRRHFFAVVFCLVCERRLPAESLGAGIHEPWLCDLHVLHGGFRVPGPAGGRHQFLFGEALDPHAGWLAALLAVAGTDRRRRTGIAVRAVCRGLHRLPVPAVRYAGVYRHEAGISPALAGRDRLRTAVLAGAAQSERKSVASIYVSLVSGANAIP